MGRSVLESWVDVITEGINSLLYITVMTDICQMGNHKQMSYELC